MRVAGGYSGVDVDTSEDFSVAKAISQLLKEGTFVLPGTDTIELADGKKYSEVKRCEIGIRSADVDHNVNSAFALIKAAEELSNNLHFRFNGVDGTKVIVKNVLPTIVREMNQHGKFCATRIKGKAIAETESELITVVPVPTTVLVDSYSEINQCTYRPVYGGDGRYGQSFKGDGSILKSCKFYLSSRIYDHNYNWGYCHARLYAHTGVYGTSSLPIGSPLAISDSVAIASLPALPSFALFTFNFSNGIKLESNVPYCIMFTYIGGTSLNYPCVGLDTMAPTHSGNAMRPDKYYSREDACFYVYGEKAY